MRPPPSRDSISARRCATRHHARRAWRTDGLRPPGSNSPALAATPPARPRTGRRPVGLVDAHQGDGRSAVHRHRATRRRTGSSSTTHARPASRAAARSAALGEPGCEGARPTARSARRRHVHDRGHRSARRTGQHARQRRGPASLAQVVEPAGDAAVGDAQVAIGSGQTTPLGGGPPPAAPPGPRRRRRVPARQGRDRTPPLTIASRPRSSHYSRRPDVIRCCA